MSWGVKCDVCGLKFMLQNSAGGTCIQPTCNGTYHHVSLVQQATALLELFESGRQAQTMAALANEGPLTAAALACSMFHQASTRETSSRTLCASLEVTLIAYADEGSA